MRSGELIYSFFSRGNSRRRSKGAREMVRVSRPKRIVFSLLALVAAIVFGMASTTPVQAATNPTLGDLSAANPTANRYAGCVASVLVGQGVTFGSLSALGANLAAIWSALP